MANDELEPGPDPSKHRSPRSRRPEPPARVPAALQSYNDDRPYSIRRPTEAEAVEVKREISAAVYYLRRWEDMDVRVRPYVTEHYVVGGREYDVKKMPPEVQAAVNVGAHTDHYWKANFYVARPKDRGIRVMSTDRADMARTRALEARGITPGAGQQPPAKHRRTVERRAT